MIPLLQVENLKRHFVAERTVFGRPISSVMAVDGVSFSLEVGDTFGLVGESGCGKSTLGRLLLRLIEPQEGRIVFDGRDITKLKDHELRSFRRHAQLIFQDPYASLNPRMTIEQILLEPLFLHNVVPAEDRKQRVAELLRLVGLPPTSAAQRYPHEFSGGQRQRIAIARALAVQPKLIICDEPVSALDVSIRAQVLNLLRELQQRFGLTYVFISHDLSVVKHIANKVAVMNLGQIVELAPAREFFACPKHPYSRALLSAIPVPNPQLRHERVMLHGELPSALAPPPGCRFHTRCPFVVERCRTEVPQLRFDANGHAAACHRVGELPPVKPLGGSRISPELEGLMAAFRNTDRRTGSGVDSMTAPD